MKKTYIIEVYNELTGKASIILKEINKRKAISFFNCIIKNVKGNIKKDVTLYDDITRQYGSISNKNLIKLHYEIHNKI